MTFKSTVYLFSNLLAVYLFGMALGSHLISKQLDTLKDPMRLFGFAQVVIGIWGMLSVLIIYKASDFTLGANAMLGQMSLAKDTVVTIGLMALTFLVPAILIGMAYPLILRVITESMDRLGKSVGEVYAFNTSGAIIGSLAAGFLMLPIHGLLAS